MPGEEEYPHVLRDEKGERIRRIQILRKQFGVADPTDSGGSEVLLADRRGGDRVDAAREREVARLADVCIGRDSCGRLHLTGNQRLQARRRDIQHIHSAMPSLDFLRAIDGNHLDPGDAYLSPEHLDAADDDRYRPLIDLGTLQCPEHHLRPDPRRIAHRNRHNRTFHENLRQWCSADCLTCPAEKG
jgi:hypothetical protein